MENLKKQLAIECDYRMRDETMDMFCSLMTEVELKNHEPLITYGKFDDNIYIVKDGVMRYAYFDGLKERTFAFACSGSMIIIYHSFYMHTTSVYQLESVGKSVVMKVSKTKLQELLDTSKDFVAWFMRMQTMQLYLNEMKSSVISGTAKERFIALVKNRPEIMKKVSSRAIASYIGITPQSLSRLKKLLDK